MTIRQINPFGEPSIVQAIVSLYQLCFGGEPWNEGLRCPYCQAVFALAQGGELCPLCLDEGRYIVLVACWPTAQVTADFYAEMRRDEAVCLVAENVDGRVSGFAWGYRLTVTEGLDAYLDAPGLHAHLRESFFYLDECAVMPTYQGQGIGKQLVRHVLGVQRHRRILLRTKGGSAMHHLTGKLGGTVVQYISQERVIMELVAP